MTIEQTKLELAKLALREIEQYAGATIGGQMIQELARTTVENLESEDEGLVRALYKLRKAMPRSILIGLVTALALISGSCRGKRPELFAWRENADSYRMSTLCVDGDGKIRGRVEMRFPNVEPGVWYAYEDFETQIGHYISRQLAVVAVSRAVAGCPAAEGLEEGQKRDRLLADRAGEMPR